MVAWALRESTPRPLRYCTAACSGAVAALVPLSPRRPRRPILWSQPSVAPSHAFETPSEQSVTNSLIHLGPSPPPRPRPPPSPPPPPPPSLSCPARQTLPDDPWNWNAYLFPLWLLGVVVRNLILFPLR